MSHTGSNNTQRVILNIILKIPAIIRKAETLLRFKWNETKEQLTALGEDIFCYFGLGCRFENFVPKGYSLLPFFEAYLIPRCHSLRKNITITITTKPFFWWAILVIR
jgi:hypothetical protein